MRIYMLTGAMIGFGLGIALGLNGGIEWPSTLWRACVGAAALGLLMRWWGRMWARGLQAALEQRRAEPAAAPRQPGPNPAKKQ